MKRPIGYTVIAVLLVLWCLTDLAGTFRTNHLVFGISTPLWRQLLSVVSGIAAVTAAAALWSQRRWARAAYAVWAMLAAVAFGYSYFVLIPATARVLLAKTSPGTPWFNTVMVPLAIDFVAWACVLGLGYWYLRARPASPGLPSGPRGPA